MYIQCAVYSMSLYQCYFLNMLLSHLKSFMIHFQQCQKQKVATLKYVATHKHANSSLLLQLFPLRGGWPPMARLTTATCYNKARKKRNRSVLRGADIDIDYIIIWQLSRQYHLLFFVLISQLLSIPVISNTPMLNIESDHQLTHSLQYLFTC